jgi:hypothetical protein
MVKETSCGNAVWRALIGRVALSPKSLAPKPRPNELKKEKKQTSNKQAKKALCIPQRVRGWTWGLAFPQKHPRKLHNRVPLSSSGRVHTPMMTTGHSTPQDTQEGVPLPTQGSPSPPKARRKGRKRCQTLLRHVCTRAQASSMP